MTRQIIGTLSVTIAFTVGAVGTALVLEIPQVQAYLGLAAHDIADWYRVGPAYLGIALCSGLFVDAVRFAATRWSDKRPQVRRDMEDLFRQNLA